MTVGEICCRDVVFARAEETVLEAARLMGTCHVGCLVVVRGEEGRRVPVGILTDRDVVVRVVARGRDPATTRIDAVASQSVTTATESDGIPETVARMRLQGVRRVPVVDGEGGLRGILSLDDILPILAEQLAGLGEIVAREGVRERRSSGKG